MIVEKRKVYGTIIGVTLFVLFILGITYAIFQWTSGTNNNTNVKLTVSKDLENLIIYKQGNSILETAGQTLEASENYSGGISATIEFYKKPTTKVIYGRINMEILNMLSASNTTDANIKKTDTIKWAITTWTSSNTAETLLNEGTFNGKEIGNIFPLHQDFELSTTRTFFKIYLWFDQNAVNEELSVSGELLSTEISAEATDVMSMYGDAAVTLNNLGLSVSSGTPDFSKTSCSSGCEESTVGIYESQDNLGTTYYFRGDVENNYVYFANYYWRIIRINGDGGIRMIYDGTTPHDNGESSTDRQTGTSAFNSSDSSNAYVGYKYGSTSATTYEETHKNTTNSTIKQSIDSWYKTNISDKGFSSYLVDSIYCNDRSLSSGTGIGTTETIYKAGERLNTNKTPTFYCAQSNDKFTVNTSKGNGSLQYPVGLITLDELMYAGATSKANSSLYLSTGTNYFTMTPATINPQLKAANFGFNSSKIIEYTTVSSSYGIRPVITLNGSTKLQGTGTKTDPFRLPDPEPNAPNIVNGLIPVVYDESSSTWVKADSTNNNNSWYNYDNKLWANAVLVSDTGFDYPITSKSVNISNGAGTGVYSNTNQKKSSTTSSTTFTITTGSTAGTISFNYTVSSESNYDKLIVTLDGTEKLNKSGNLTTATAFSMDVSANTTYTMIIKYTKDGSGDTGTDTATITDLTFPTGATVTITPDATYPFGEQLNQKIGSKFTYDTSTNQYTISDTISTAISSSTIGKYICPDISQTSCSTMYKVTESNTTITKVEEYGVPTTRSDVRSTYTNASEGTEIREDDILAFYVWIPRYKYRVWNISKQAGAESTYAYNAKTEGIDIVFEVGTGSTGTINCEYNYNVDSANGGVDLSTTTAETCTGSNGQYYTHPAFTFGNDELRGFWISKYEISSSSPTTTDGGGNVTNLTVRSLPNVNSWRNIQVSKISTVIQNMQTSSNIYGLNTSRTNTDSHMLTNYEWGAVAYLTNSKYGRCTDGSCTEVTINNCSNYITGIGANTVSAGSSSTTCTTAANQYNGTYGKLASTTGNVTGVYDMSGGSWEYVMGNISKVTTGYTFYPSSSSFSSSWYTTDTAKYVTTYAYDTVSNNQKAYNRGRLGDATAETLLSASTSGGWYSDNAFFPYSSDAWFNRGGGFFNGSNAGVFGFGRNYGNNDASDSSRAALVSLSA